MRSSDPLAVFDFYMEGKGEGKYGAERRGEVLSPPIGDSRSNGGEGRRASRGSWVGASRHHLNFPR